MWWPYIPWLLFLLVLGGTLAAYQIGNRQEHGRTGAACSTQGPDKYPKEQ